MGSLAVVRHQSNRTLRGLASDFFAKQLNKQEEEKKDACSSILVNASLDPKPASARLGLFRQSGNKISKNRYSFFSEWLRRHQPLNRFGVDQCR